MPQLRLLAGRRQSGESSKAVQGCNDYLRMGPGRTVAALVRRYQKRPGKESPSQSDATLNKWARRYDWRERSEAYDAQLEARKNARAEKIMSTGLALDHERVVKLKRLARLLMDQLYETTDKGELFNLWLPDVKQIGSGDGAERIDLVRFNSRLLEQLRGTLDDLAKETGGRRQKIDTDVTTKGEALTDGVSRRMADALDEMTPEQVVDRMLAMFGGDEAGDEK